MSVETRIRNCKLEEYLFSVDRSMRKSMDLVLKTGTFGSTGFLKVGHFLEDDFGVVVDDHEQPPANFGSVSRLNAYVARKL